MMCTDRDKDGRRKWRHSCLANALRKGHSQSVFLDARQHVDTHSDGEGELRQITKSNPKEWSRPLSK